MSKREFIRKNRVEIDAAIRDRCPNVGTLNDDDRAQWLDNDETLYGWYEAEKDNNATYEKEGDVR